MLTTEPERPSSRLSHTLEDHVIRTPIKSLGVCMRATNAANAVALIVTGLVSILSGAALGNGGRRLLSTMLLSIYAAGFGALLLRCELQPASDHLRATYGFLFTWTGRLAFILLAGNLTWTLAPLGAYVAVCTNVNAAYHAFVLAKHPAFVEGRVSGLSLTSSDGQVVDSAWAARDPASVAAESRASPAQFR